ncbi:MAG: ATP-binding cassette domain-containing protein [Flavobacteriales bacterium]|nr:ATP-binding cassette domain-containing protein [Flavobacteriales bacterium]
MENEVLVSVEGVSKKFCKDLRTSLRYGMRDIGNELIGRPRTTQLRDKEFWAVQDVGFELKRGECLGLIGKNGAGKTTLLRMLNGLIKPDHGQIEMRGRVGALIALGAGFNPILTGRENIFINGSVLGLSHSEINARLDEIIDFSELAEFIDMPVQSYSSGMSVRLGFAVATALEPDVLILDEVLAVGDAAFRHKCYRRINGIMKNCAVILVSHSMSQIGAVASSVGMMRKGRMEYFPNINDGIAAYNNDNADYQGISESERVFNTYPPVNAAKLSLVEDTITYGGTLQVELETELDAPIDNALISFTVTNANEQSVMNWHSTRSGHRIVLPTGRSVLRFQIDPLLLHDGRYRWNLWVGEVGSIEAKVYIMRGGEFTVKSNHKPVTDIPYLPDATKFTITPLTPYSERTERG